MATVFITEMHIKVLSAKSANRRLFGELFRPQCVDQSPPYQHYLHVAEVTSYCRNLKRFVIFQQQIEKAHPL